MRTRIWWSVALLLVAGLVGQIAFYWSQRPDTIMHASWRAHPKTLGEARRLAKSIVLANVVDVQPGQDLVTSAAAEPSGEDRIPTQMITLEIVKAYKGSYRAGQQVKLFQTGGVLVSASGDNEEAMQTAGRRFIIEGDPLYRAGEQYMLMLTDGPQGAVRTIAPEGRYRVQDGQLTAMTHSDLAHEISHKGLQSLEAELVASGK